MKSLKKVTSILELFLSNDEDLSLSDLSKLSGLHKTTIYRIVSFLVSQGYLKQREKRGKYSLGMKFLDFSGAIKKRMKIRELALPYLDKLSKSIKETILLQIWDGKESVLAETIHSDYVLQAIPNEGTKVPLHSSAGGKVFLAYMTKEGLKKYCNDSGLKALTPNTITNLNELKKQLITVKKEGIGFDYEETLLGASGVGAGIKDAQGNITATVNILGPTVRLSKARLRELAPEVKICALEISRELGWKEK